MLNKNIFLTGFMGTGKSTVGKLLAQKLNREFIDLDQVIEDREGKTISEIFQEKGEGYFRELESSLLREVSGKKGIVVATGGGTLLSDENFLLAQNYGITILLKANPKIIKERVDKEEETRPLLAGNSRLLKITTLLEERRERYNRFQYQIDTSALSVEQVIAEIITICAEGRHI